MPQSNNPGIPRVPLFRLALDENDRTAVDDVLRSGQISRGQFCREFEAEFSNFIGGPDSVAFSSGSSALHAAMLALELPTGSEVIVPALTFVATAFAPQYVGCTPIFAEVDPQTLTLDPLDVRQKMTARTRAIIAVDFAGQVSAMTELSEIAREAGIYLVVDAAHSVGARFAGERVGNHADLTAYSFFATKNLSGAEGGAVVTRSKEFYGRLQRIKAHGIVWPAGPRISGKHDVVELGYNFHPSNLNLALARSQLRSLDVRNKERKHLAARLTALIREWDVEGLVGTPIALRDHVFHLYIIRLRLDRLSVDRDQVMADLATHGIETGLYYRPVHLFTFFQEKFGFRPGMLPLTEQICQEILALPFFPGISDSELQQVSDGLRKVAQARKR